MTLHHHFLVHFCLFILPLFNFSLAQEAPDEITFDLPNGEEITFRAIYLGLPYQENKPLMSKSLTLGSRSGTHFGEWLADVSIAGSFAGFREKTQQKEWLYYLAETELTQGQWTSLMGGSTNEPRHPQTGLSLAQIALFMEKLNLHLLSEQENKLPLFGGALAFCRLPTEAEWEFAARGGDEVDALSFDAPHPYPNGKPINAYEWSRSNTRNGRLQECGILEKNPIGLYDMLGNACEITLSPYSLEYGLGRVGGHVTRGGTAAEDPENLRASRRIEHQSFLRDGSLRRDGHTGFRVALGSRLIGPENGIDKLTEAWQEYQLNRPVGTASISDALALNRENEILKAELAQVKRENNANLPPGSSQDNNVSQDEIERLKNNQAKLEMAIQRLTQLNRDSEKKKSYALVRTASAAAHLVYDNGIKAEKIEKIIGESENVENVRLAKMRSAALREKQLSCLRVYHNDLKLLADSNYQIVDEEIRRWREELSEIDGSTQQVLAIDVLEEHLNSVRKKVLPDAKKLQDDIMKKVKESEETN